MTPFDLLALLLVAAGLIGCGNHLYVGLPPAIGLLLGSLIVAAVALAVDPLVADAPGVWLRAAMTQLNLPDLFLGGILGLLLFAATFQVSLAELRKNQQVILLLATASVILSTVLFSFGLYGICVLVGYELPLRWCAVIGAVLAPTDAVVVDDLLRRVPMPAPLRGAIAGESLLNDGASVVLFVITLQLAGETLRSRTLKLGEQLRHAAAGMLGPGMAAAAPASAITLSLDSTFIRSCHKGERHLEVRVGNAETAAGGSG